MKDLALLVADKNMDFALRGILQRHESLGIRAVTYETQLHAGRDGGVRASGPERTVQSHSRTTWMGAWLTHGAIGRKQSS
jgi:hypothetical protein